MTHSVNSSLDAFTDLSYIAWIVDRWPIFKICDGINMICLKKKLKNALNHNAFTCTLSDGWIKSKKAQDFNLPAGGSTELADNTKLCSLLLPVSVCVWLCVRACVWSVTAGQLATAAPGEVSFLAACIVLYSCRSCCVLSLKQPDTDTRRKTHSICG